MKSKALKVGGGVTLGGGGAIALVFGLHQDVNSKISKVEIKSEKYVRLVLEPVNVEIKNLKEDVNETKDMVRDIHRYLLKSNHK